MNGTGGHSSWSTRAGWSSTGTRLDAKVTEQALRALGEADLVLLVLDTTTGLTGDDTVVAQLVRRAAGSVIVVANKVDSDRREVDAWEFAGLGLGEPAMVSALHGRGFGDLLDEVVKLLPEASMPVEASGSGRGTRGSSGPQCSRRGDSRQAECRQVDSVQPALG